MSGDTWHVFDVEELDGSTAPEWSRDDGRGTAWHDGSCWRWVAELGRGRRARWADGQAATLTDAIAAVDAAVRSADHRGGAT